MAKLNEILNNKSGWWRVSLVATLVWVIVMIAVVSGSRMRWWSSYSGPQEAFWYTAVGAILVILIFNAVPWVAEAFVKEPKNDEPNAASVTNSDPAKTSSKPANSREIVRCSNCNKETYRGFGACSHCGASLT